MDVSSNPARCVHQWASYQIRKIAGCACAGNAGIVFPRRRLQRKPLVSDPGMHHGTCVTHVPWCMSGSFNCGDGENVPGIPGACAPAILRIWQEAHSFTVAIMQVCNYIRCLWWKQIEQTPSKLHFSIAKPQELSTVKTRNCRSVIY